MSNGVQVLPPLPPVGCTPLQGNPPFPVQKTLQWGGYPPVNPTSAWSGFAPPPTGCVYGLDGITQSWVPVVTMWQVQCLVQAGLSNTITEAPQDGNDYVRNGSDHTWINVQDLDLDGGTYP
jgi:hypothetical protein